MNEYHNGEANEMIGPEVDKLLAEVNGWTEIKKYSSGAMADGLYWGIRPDGMGWHHIPAYSTSDHDALDWIKALMNSGSKARELAAEILEGFSDYSNPGDGLLAFELVKAVVVYDYCTPLRLNYCWQIKPALAALLKGDGRV